MSQAVRGLMFGFAVWAMATVAAAQLSEVDLVAGSGDAKVTLDAATGLYWLDPGEVVNLSVPDVLSGAGGWVATGWRYATQIEICDLFAAYAIAVPNCGFPAGGQAAGDVVGALQVFLGTTSEDASIRSTVGFYDDGGDPTRVGIARVQYQKPPADLSITVVQSNATSAVALPSIGNWLVRDTPVPVPVFPYATPSD